ncbi:MAG: hypothetical protein HOE19_03090 [Candidatus Komeilibacteria bacterium]|nr:hypothetical protein [Candidatus Komeilibacteria bacterium]MBT4447662.1 hypothetical protein [Candidatus Komeilibacteria bacterium]
MSEKEKLTPDNENNPVEQAPENMESVTGEISADEIAADKAYAQKVGAEDIDALAAQRESMGLEQVTQDANETSVEQEEGIENTKDFDKAIISGDTAKAEAWLESVKDGKYENNERWLDHRSGDLFRAYRDTGDFDGAQRMIDILPEGRSKEGRAKNLKDVMESTELIDPLAAEKQAMGEAIAEEEAMPDIPETEARTQEIEDLWGDVFKKMEKEKKEAESLDDFAFIEALDNDDFVTSGKWLFANKTKINHSGGQEFLDRASGKLFEELLKSGNLDLAASMISINANDEVRQNMRAKLAQARQAKENK